MLGKVLVSVHNHNKFYLYDNMMPRRLNRRKESQMKTFKDVSVCLEHHIQQHQISDCDSSTFSSCARRSMQKNFPRHE